MAEGMFPTMVGEWILVVDQRGEDYANMSADEYASRVLAVNTKEGQDRVRKAMFIGLVSPDMEGLTVIKNGGTTGIGKLEVVQAIGHEQADGPITVRLDDVVEFIEGLDTSAYPIVISEVAEEVREHFDPSK